MSDLSPRGSPPARTFIDGPISVYIYVATSREILEALERVQKLVMHAALELQREISEGRHGPRG
jgi:hypothetical protein